MEGVSFGIFDHMDWRDDNIRELIREKLELVKIYEKFGFYGIHLAEHHFTQLSVNVNPGLFLASASQLTSKLRLCTLAYVVPTYHPLRLAEEISLLDNLTGGRLEIGFTNGINMLELKQYGLEINTAREMGKEAVDIILKYFVGKPLTFIGNYYKLEDVEPVLLPLQKPHPPIWIPTRNINTVPWIAKNGFNIATGLGELEEAKQILGKYRSVYRENELRKEDSNPPKLALQRIVYVSTTDEKARADVVPAIRKFAENITYISRKYGSEYIGHRPSSEYKQLSVSQLLDVDYQLSHDIVIAGSPRTVTEKIKKSLDETGANYFMAQISFGSLTFNQVIESLTLFHDEVMPSFIKK
ncbi:LLM class flavin-dependent oxidoreductase [Sulfolobus tengchongensis]|uniref:LLM class flavin-dependent oxidoreductase n=1 Tax=Sulfolobus tengchongensis TaxID=207809 RepID=A0AAX4L4N6_9CREN